MFLKIYSIDFPANTFSNPWKLFRWICETRNRNRLSSLTVEPIEHGFLHNIPFAHREFLPAITLLLHYLGTIRIRCSKRKMRPALAFLSNNPYRRAVVWMARCDLYQAE